jgi:hypothetical protein
MTVERFRECMYFGVDLLVFALECWGAIGEFSEGETSQMLRTGDKEND